MNGTEKRKSMESLLERKGPFERPFLAATPLFHNRGLWLYAFLTMLLMGTSACGTTDRKAQPPGKEPSASVSPLPGHEMYVLRYRDIAVEEMNRTGIPASIKLAQGILESGGGRSYLVRTGNNHFGVKCPGGWQGGGIRLDDDRKNECFRIYRSCEHSFRDHSDFLKSNPRYASLFELDPCDYKGWAEGLEQAGYATSPGYARRLIQLIEQYQLHEYDRLADSDGAASRGLTSGWPFSLWKTLRGQQDNGQDP